LVVAIIRQAVIDYQNSKKAIPEIKKKIKELDQQISEEVDTIAAEKMEVQLADKRRQLRAKQRLLKDAETFFQKQWFEELADALNLDAGKVRKKLGTGKLPEKVL